MSHEESLAKLLEVFRGESFAVFSFAGEKTADPPYANVMFFAETPAGALVFATTPGPLKGTYLREGNGVCAEVDTRGVGLEGMSRFARVTLQGALRRIDADPERASARSLYLAKLPHARTFMERPGVEVWSLEPSHAVYARGFFERFELDFRADSA